MPELVLVNNFDFILGVECISSNSIGALFVRPPYSPRLIVLDNPNVVFLICDTKVRHDLASSEYNVRRETCVAAAEKMGKASLREASIHDLESR